MVGLPKSQRPTRKLGLKTGHMQSKSCVVELRRPCDIVRWHTNPRINCQKVSTPCLDDHQCAKNDFERVGGLADVCAQLVEKTCFISHTNLSTRHLTDSQCISSSCHQMEQMTWDEMTTVQPRSTWGIQHWSLHNLWLCPHPHLHDGSSIAAKATT